MSQPRFKKAPKWVGKHLTLNVGRADKTIGDHEILDGSKWARFVGMGFLVPFKEPEKKAATPAPKAPATPPAPKDPVDPGKAPADPSKGKAASEEEVNGLIEKYTKAELYAVAGDVELKGRSSLNEAELAKALIEEMGGPDAVSLKADELKQAAEVEANRQGSASKSPAAKAAAQQDASKAGKTSTKKAD